MILSTTPDMKLTCVRVGLGWPGRGGGEQESDVLGFSKQPRDAALNHLSPRRRGGLDFHHLISINLIRFVDNSRTGRKEGEKSAQITSLSPSPPFSFYWETNRIPKVFCSRRNNM